MRRIVAVCLLFLLIPACGRRQNEMDEILLFRETLLQSQGCTFSCKISADYGSEVWEFAADCSADREGNITFSITAPESIAGIKGQISASGGRFTFDNAVLGFPLLADGTLSPASAPWIFMRSIRSGYLISCGHDSEGVRINVNDSYEDDALMLDILMDTDSAPEYAEIFWKGRRILAMDIENFEIL